VCLTEKQAVAWIQSLLEPACGKKGKRGAALPAPVKRVSWNPAEMGKNMRGDREEPIPDMMKEDQQPTE
jgi:hypothetical protein